LGCGKSLMPLSLLTFPMISYFQLFSPPYPEAVEKFPALSEGHPSEVDITPAYG